VDEGDRDVRYEPSHPSKKAIAVCAGLVAGLIALSIGAATLVTSRSPTPASAPNNARPPAIRGPVLETAPRAGLEAYRKEKQDAIERIDAAIPLAATFSTDTGAPRTLGDVLAGKPAAVVLGYLRCRDLCPMTLAGLTEALAASGLEPARGYRAVFVSIDPDDDSAALASARDDRIPARERDAWRFLGGGGQAVEALAKAIGYRYGPEAGTEGFAHSAGFAIVTPAGRVARRFTGVRFDPAEVRSAMEAAAYEEAPANGLERFAMWCSHLDPLTGRHSATILAILRIAALGALAVLAATAWGRARRRGRGR
jgi:protein SCO1/2